MCSATGVVIKGLKCNYGNCRGALQETLSSFCFDFVRKHLFLLEELQNATFASPTPPARFQTSASDS